MLIGCATVIDPLSLLAGLTMGLLGGAHCIGMCGGIIGALTMAVDKADANRRWILLMLYNLGRIVSYVLIAIIFYWIVESIENYFALDFMRYLAGILLIAMGLYIGSWWRGLVYLEKVGSVVWRFIQPLSKSLVPVKKKRQALLLGMVWGWLPCGLIYSALAYSSTASSTFEAAFIMLSFALGTLPAVLLSGLVADRVMVLVKHKLTRSLMGLIMIVFGVWTLMNNHALHQHSTHAPSSMDSSHLEHQHH